jgi:hypothetical protein
MKPVNRRIAEELGVRQPQIAAAISFSLMRSEASLIGRFNSL